MHTFFINTSKKSLNGYDVLFDIHLENKSLVLMESPMNLWYDKEQGYISCAKKMSEMIDGYAELNNAFNLILYIDLLEIEAYANIKRDALHDKEREHCSRAFQILFTHLISGTIVAELEQSGRKPQNVLIMLGEEKKLSPASVGGSLKRDTVASYLLDAIGIPKVAVIEETAKEIEKNYAENRMQIFQERVEASCKNEFVCGIRDSYAETMQLWYDQIINEANVEIANTALFDRIEAMERNEMVACGMGTVLCPYDAFACKVNKSEMALRKLNMVIYILMCVENNTVFTDDYKTGGKKVVPFHSFTADEIAPLFKKKEWCFASEVNKIESLDKTYSDPGMGLAPELPVLDNFKFGLDIYGDKRTDLIVTDAEDENSVPADEEEDQRLPVSEGKKKEMVEVERKRPVLLKGYERFDYDYEVADNFVCSRKVKPEEYVEQAKKVRKQHLDYLKKLKIHFSEVLSNYAGKSKLNKPALLRVGEKQYSVPEAREERPLESVQVVSQKAYDTIMDEYMDFCAGRSVSVTDIEEQCNWFVSRIHQISESLKKIKLVAICLFAAIIMLYAPFFLIQFEEITANAHSMYIASYSFIIPLALVYFVFALLSAIQRKEYAKAWKQFKEKADEMMNENKAAVQKYDQLLSTIIPALRWIYDYRLDVDYCIECCAVADAKMEHHRRKLRDRVSAIKMILSDLEYDELAIDADLQREKNPDGVLDYNSAFCSGSKNRGFYSVVDNSFFTQTVVVNNNGEE